MSGLRSMRQVLFRIWLQQPWSGWTEAVPGDPFFGAGWVCLIAAVVYYLYHVVRGHREIYAAPSTALTWGGGLLALTLAPRFLSVPQSVPVFGYGLMVLIGFLSAMAFSYHRAKQVGFNPELVMDSAFWLLVSGVAGGRLAFLIQYGGRVFANVRNPWQAFMAAINLSEGGLVLIGALVGGAAGFFAFCWYRKISSMEFADILIPGIFIGIGFGRIGCLLNGCCFGDRCDLPWAITFPHGSVTFGILAERGFIDPNAPATIPLHPTQIYSSIDGFILAIVTGIYYWYRRYPGDVLALGCILYPLTRIQIEFLRADEMGQFGTGLTISQLYSIGILLCGLVLMAIGPLRGKWAAARRSPAEQLPAASDVSSPAVPLSR
ncbi:prolipoprotein diacylglyceryl transferase [Planctomicrobium sp. SH664]|uniref:prolipoprotein diacylglyceryl transferase n=1 Tax=Planctomicrobium sp. SH664 TaxID=3448125 RepID=UPI003F5BAFCB